MTAMIESKYATLETLAVTVQALHVSGKQLTLAVFRQLPVQTETDEAELWGIVRYAIKEEGALWLTFSLSGILYRRALRVDVPNRLRYRAEEAEGDMKRANHAMNAALRNQATNTWDTPERKQQGVEKAEQDIGRAFPSWHRAYKALEVAEAGVATDTRLIAELPQLFIAV